MCEEALFQIGDTGSGDTAVITPAALQMQARCAAAARDLQRRH